MSASEASRSEPMTNPTRYRETPPRWLKAGVTLDEPPVLAGSMEGPPEVSGEVSGSPDPARLAAMAVISAAGLNVAGADLDAAAVAMRRELEVAALRGMSS